MSAQFFSPIKLNLPTFSTRQKANSTATAKPKESATKRKPKSSPMLLESLTATTAVAAAALIPAPPQDVEIHHPTLSHTGYSPDDDSVSPPEAIHDADELGVPPTDDDWIFESGHPDELSEPPPQLEE